MPPPVDKGGDVEVVRESERRRYSDVGRVDKVRAFARLCLVGKCASVTRECV